MNSQKPSVVRNIKGQGALGYKKPRGRTQVVLNVCRDLLSKKYGPGANVGVGSLNDSGAFDLSKFFEKSHRSSN